MSTNEINLREARARIGYLIERAEHAGEITIITRHGHPAAAIVPISLVPQEPAMATTPATAQELSYAVSLTLGDHAADFNIDAIVEEIRATHSGIASIDDIPSEDYWAIVARHDTSAQRYTLSLVEGESPFSNGEDLQVSGAVTYEALDADTRAWLDENGYDATHPDRWVLVTPAGEDPNTGNVIASRDVTV